MYEKNAKIYDTVLRTLNKPLLFCNTLFSTISGDPQLKTLVEVCFSH